MSWMDDDPDTGELRREQAERARDEHERAQEAREETETRAHERRAEKADYLRRKLAEREESERQG